MAKKARKQKKSMEKVDNNILNDDKNDSSKKIGNLEQESNSEHGTDKEIKWIFGGMAFLIIIILIAAYIMWAQKNFEYEGLKFNKEKFGEIPVFHYSYFFNSLTGKTIQYNLYLRNDPRKIDILVEGEINYPEGKFVYISVNATGITQCEDSSIAIATLSAFLTNNDLSVRGATVNKDEAENNSVKFANCNTHPDNVVILIQGGEETKIWLEKNKCYVINVANCEIMQAIEKFELKSVIDARKRAQKKQ